MQLASRSGIDIHYKAGALMTSLENKIKLALDESRMLILGAQILLGFQFRAILEQGFHELPRSSQVIELIALGLLLLAIALIMWPGAYHRIVWEGVAELDVHEFTTKVMDVALLPFLVALALEVYVMSHKLLGFPASILVSAVSAILAILSWYGLGVIGHSLGGEPQLANEAKGRSKHMDDEERLFDKVEQVLIEARMVLPGVQALLGFQLATMLLEGFDRLPISSKYLHLISLGLMAFTMMLLMAPAAYHRIVEHGEATEHFHRVAGNLLLLAMVTLPLGLCGDLSVVLRSVTDSISFSLVAAVVMLALFYGFWFGFTLYRKSTLKRAKT
jgi:hypothetical protein